MITMKSLKLSALALLLVAAFITTGVYEAAAVQALYGTVGKGEHSSSALVEIDQDTGEILRCIGQVGFGVNGLAWDPTTDTLYGSTRQHDGPDITSGSHDGTYGSTILVDSSQNFISEGVRVGMQIENHSEGTWGTITAVTTTSITATLIGAPDVHWDNGDSYTVYNRMYNGLITIDLATGAGTLVGVQGWGMEPIAVVTNITVNSSGQIYGWTEEGDDLVRINKGTGIATVVGVSGLSTWANGLAFTSNNTLKMINGDGRYYYINTSSGAATYLGDISPGVEETAHHGDFHPDTDIYYGIRNDEWPWDNSSSNLLTANLDTGSVLSMVPTAFDLHTLAFVDVPGLLDLDLQYDDINNELTMDFIVGTEVPAVLQIRLVVFNQVYHLANRTFPSVDPRIKFDCSFPFPNVGRVGVLVTLVTQNGGVAYSAWETVDTGN